MAKKKMLALEISLLEDIKPATQYSLYLEDIEDDLEFIEFEFRDLKYEQLKYNINVNIYQHISNLTKIFNEEVVNNLKKTYNNIKKNLDLVVAIDRFLTDYNEIREQQINIMLDRFYLFRDLNIEANAVMIRSVNEIRNEALYRFE
jgi:lipopolysaccharide biosynthesis regulator YciM